MIRNARAYSVFNSAGRKTVKVKLFTERGVFSAAAPSGTSKGSHEAVELPVGKVLKAFSAVRQAIVGRDESDWEGIDSLLLELDGTRNFTKIGGNLAIAVSVAAARAASGGELWKLMGLKSGFPIPVGNVIGGGRHGGGAGWQEFLISPRRARNPAKAFSAMLEFWNLVGEELAARKLLAGRNIESAWMARMDDLKTLDFLSRLAQDFDMDLGVDFAASELWTGKAYSYNRLEKRLSPGEQLEFIVELARKYRLRYLEDPFHQDDFKSFAELTGKLKKALVVGDDLYCTNPVRLKLGTKAGSSSGVIIKPNQIGTLSQAGEVVKLARRDGIVPVVSHRSGDTEDTWLADLAVLWEAPLIKAGIAGGIPKHNRLIELWNEVPHARMQETLF